MILEGILLDLFFLLWEEFGHIRCTLHMMNLSIWRYECIMLFGTENLQGFPSAKVILAINFLPHTMIKTNAVGASVTEQYCVSQTVLRIVHISVTIHLEPVDVLLLWQTENTTHRRQHNHSLL